MDSSKEYKVNRYVFLSIILIFGLMLLMSLIQFFTAFLAAVILYILGKNFSNYLITKKRWKKSTAAILVIIISFFIILLPITLLITLLYNKIASVIANPSTIIDAAKHLDEVIKEQTGFEVLSDNTLASIQSFSTNILSTILNTSLNFISTILMMYFFLYFMIININRMEAGILYYLPFKREKILMFGNELVALTFSNSVGIPLIALAQGVLGYGAYIFTGVPEAGFWGVITGFCSVLPIVGSGIVWAPIAGYLLVTGGSWQGIFVLAWGALIMGSADNVIRFILAKKMADVHPIVTILGVIMGLKYFGIIGLIFGPVLISFFLILLKIYYLEYQKPLSFKPTKTRQLMPAYMQPFLKYGKKKKKPSKPVTGQKVKE